MLHDVVVFCEHIRYVVRMDQPAKVVFKRCDFCVGLGFALTNAVAHLIWSPMSVYWQFVATTLALTAFLLVWLVKSWRRLELFVTKFYCLAALFDLLAEGLLQPFHHCTVDNLFCTGRMFLVFFAFWLVLDPIERRFFARKPAVPA